MKDFSPTHCPPENTRGCTEVERAPGGVGVHSLAEETLIFHLLANQATGNGNFLTACHHLAQMFASIKNHYDLAEINSTLTM
jgi:hypothetical protein